MDKKKRLKQADRNEWGIKKLHLGPRGMTYTQRAAADLRTPEQRKDDSERHAAWKKAFWRMGPTYSMKPSWDQGRSRRRR